MQQQAERKMEVLLDRDEYDAQSLVEIKVPLNLPYVSNWSEFKRYDGEVDVNGNHYKYVKRRVYNDSLILLCLPDENKQRIQKERDNFFKLVNGLQYPGKNNHNKEGNSFFKNLLVEYYFVQNSWLFNIYKAQKVSDPLINERFCATLSCKKMDHPPEATSVI